MNWRTIRKKSFPLFSNQSPEEDAKHYQHQYQQQKKGLHVGLKNSNTYTHSSFRRKNLCVNMHDEKVATESFFVRGEMIELCDKYACVYYSKQHQDMFASVRDIFTYIKRAALFHLPHPPAHNIYERRRRKKRGGMWFSYMKAFSTNTHTTLTQRDHHMNERERDIAQCIQIHKSFPPAFDQCMYVYVVIFMFMLLFCIIAVCALLFRREKAAAGAEVKKKENKTHENNKRNISRAFAIFSFLAARMRMWKIYVCILLACCILLFSISVLPVLCFLVRERESQDTSVSFFVSKCTVRLCLVLSLVRMG